MVSMAETDQGSQLFRPLVAFDFDGTLTWRDSFRSFLAWRAGWARYVLGMARLAPAAVAWLGHRDRGVIKAAVAREFLWGVSREALMAEADRFAAEAAPRLLRPDALRCWRVWQKRNARLIIVTASPEILVAPFGRGLGAELVIGTRLKFTAEDLATGALDGPNCRAAEKVVRLKAAYGDAVRLEAAYGDSDGDLEMLALASERGMKVFGARP